MEKLFNSRVLSVVLLAITLSVLVCPNANAQKKNKKDKMVQPQQTVKEDYGNTVTLVTSGSGATEDDATRSALRNAIEQAFGTFVSSNTTVVNDELVSDAITSVSSGNVLGYEQISSFKTSEGYTVSVKAIVSIGGLVSFVQNKGMKTELAGNSFLQNMRLAKLNKENEMKALRNLADQLFDFASRLYDYSVDVGQPSGDGTYSIGVKISATPNENMNYFWDVVDRTLSSLSMSPKESQNYQTLGMKTYQYCYGPGFARFKIDNKPNLVGTKSKYILRTNIGQVAYGRASSNKETEFGLLQLIEAIETIGKYCYDIYDNIGTVITPTIEEGANKVGRSIAGFKLGQIGNEKYYSIVLKSTGNGGARFNIPSNAGMNSFQLIYSESQLSKLQNISVRPH